MTYLSMTRGNDRELSITASEDLTGSELRFTAKRYKRDTEAVIEKTSSSGIEVSGTTATVTIDSADTASLDPAALFWDLEVVDATDKVHTLARGRLAIEPNITDRA